MKTQPADSRSLHIPRRKTDMNLQPASLLQIIPAIITLAGVVAIVLHFCNALAHAI